MTWFKVDDGFWRHSKVRKLGRARAATTVRVAAVGLWTLAGNWSADNLTDGFVPKEQVEDWDPRGDLSRRLVEVGLWSETSKHGEEGYEFHEWDTWQPTRAVIEERRERWRLKKANQRGQAESTPDSPVDSPPMSPGDTPGDTTGESIGNPVGSPRDVRVPSRPVPTRPVQEELVPPLAGAKAPTANTRAQELAKAYTGLVPMSNFPAVMRVAKKAIDSGQYTDEQIHAALTRLAGDSRSVTTDTLRIELNGRVHAGRSGHRPYQNPTDPSAYDEDF